MNSAVSDCRFAQSLEGQANTLRPESASAGTAQELKTLCRTEGIDAATALLFDRVRQAPRHGEFIRAVDEIKSRPLSQKRLRATLVVAPGALYREYPHTGADGAILCEQAQKLGAVTHVIPVRSTGTLAENARQIADWLSRRPADESIVLASVSKGGSDVKCALAQYPKAFDNVVAWISVCGILDGSPLVNWLQARKWQSAIYRLLFFLRRLDFRVLTDLAYGRGAPLDFELAVPPHLQVVHVVGFPLIEHLTNRLARTSHRRIAEHGPNDGAVLLADACSQPGRIYPVWGSDHYLRPVWELRALAGALLTF